MNITKFYERFDELMFENYINIAKRKLIESIATEGSRLYLPDILSNVRVDKSYKAFFKAEVEWWIYQEKLMRAVHQNFDLINTEMDVLFQQYDSFLIKYAKFEYEVLRQLSDTAVKLRLNYLCRPRTTLKWFVFRGEPTKPEQEIIYRLNYFTDYNYIIDGFKSRLEERQKQKNKEELISISEFEKVIENIDNEYILDLSPEKFNEILEPIFYFFDELNEDKNYENREDGYESEAPIEAIILYLDDKGIKPLAHALNKEERIEKGIEYISQRKFSEFIYSYLVKLEKSSEEKVIESSFHIGERESGENLVENIYDSQKEDFAADEYFERALDEVEVEEDVVDFVDLGSNILNEDIKQNDSENNIENDLNKADGSVIYSHFIEERKAGEDLETKDIIINNSEIDDEFLETSVTGNRTDNVMITLKGMDEEPVRESFDKNIEQYVEVPSGMTGQDTNGMTKLKPLSELISERLENKFIKKLFNRNTANYFSLLNSLQYCTSWRETAKTIDKFFMENGINPNTSLAETFRDKIQERFL